MYEPLLHGAIHNRWAVVTVATAFVAFCLLVSTRMGSEFIPQLDEGDMAVQAMRIPSTSLSQAVEMQNHLEKAILTVPEVERVYAQTGTQEVATDPMPPSVSDVFIIMKPRSAWSDPDKLKTTLVKEVEGVIADLPGNNYEFTQPIQMRFNELISGIRSDVAVKIFGDDLDVMLKSGQQIASILQDIPGQQT
ncbi:MAG: efflux RND transporter permease subunit [bacterium]|nr:efflux RND transporter permease subunit [bacterium]